MKNNYTLILIITALIIFIIYDKTNVPTYFVDKKKKIWVYAEINQIFNSDTTHYYYMGQINEEVINAIDNNLNPNGLFKLSNIRYWNNDDLLQVYDDEESFDYKIFQIEEIDYLKSYKKDPVFLYDMEELHESSKKIRLKEQPRTTKLNSKKTTS